jgi:GNAT superfamily N-acetyltransferase
VSIAIQWAQKEGWNPGVHDAECFYSADPNGFYAAKISGELAGTVSIVKYSDNFAFGGLYIVKPEFRGRGIGRALLKFVENKSRSFNLGIDCVEAMQEKYARDGYKFAYTNTRYKGKANGKFSKICKPIRSGNFEEIARFDEKFFPANRSKFLKCWLFQKDAAALMVKENAEVLGYGVIRKCFEGYKIGPLFAQNKQAATSLFESLTSTVPQQTVFLDVPQPNKAAIELAENNMQPVFKTARMYTKTAPPLPLDKIFGITTFELG